MKAIVNIKFKFQISVLMFSFVLANTTLIGQNHLEINFAGTSTNPETVYVENLTQGEHIALHGQDTLHLNIVTVGIQDFEKPNNYLTIYPNPTNSSTVIEFVNTKNGNVVFQLFRVDGKMIYNYCANFSQGKHHLLLLGVPAGFYFVNIITESADYTGRLVSSGQTRKGLSIKPINDFPTETNENDDKISNPKNAGKSNSNKTIRIMNFEIGDQLRFVGFKSGYKNDTINVSPTYN